MSEFAGLFPSGFGLRASGFGPQAPAFRGCRLEWTPKPEARSLTPEARHPISNRLETESSLWILLMASAIRLPIESVFSFGHSPSFSSVGMLLVAMTCEIGEALI